MAMYKSGSPFKEGPEQQQVVVDVLQGEKCEKCEAPLNLLGSTGGTVPCENCGHGNELDDMSEGETTNE